MQCMIHRRHTDSYCIDTIEKSWTQLPYEHFTNDAGIAIMWTATGDAHTAPLTFHSLCRISVTVSILTNQMSCLCCSSCSPSWQTSSVSQVVFSMQKGSTFRMLRIQNMPRGETKANASYAVLSWVFEWKSGPNVLDILVSVSQWGNDYSLLSLRMYSERFKQLQFFNFIRTLHNWTLVERYIDF